MPRDMEKMKAYNDKWKKKNTVQYLLRVTNKSGIPTAVSKVAKKQGISETAVVRQALIEKLQREGYLSGEGYPSGEGYLPRGSLPRELREILIDNDYIRENL